MASLGGGRVRRGWWLVGGRGAAASLRVSEREREPLKTEGWTSKVFVLLLLLSAHISNVFPQICSYGRAVT